MRRGTSYAVPLIGLSEARVSRGGTLDWKRGCSGAFLEAGINRVWEDENR